LGQISNLEDYRGQKAPKMPKSPIERLLADARLRLVETGTRNRLVHTPRNLKRTRSLSILKADADSMFETAARSGKSMHFLPADRAPNLAPEGNVERIVQSPLASAVLQTNLDLEPLEKRLLTIYRDAKTAEEEQGINILFLAIGFLRWYEDDKSDVLREAPLILVPVTLTRQPRRSTFDLRGREEDIATNQALQERLRTNFNVTLPELPENEEWRPSEYFAAVREAVAGKSRWSIDANGVELGFYSFSKLLMIRDLDPESWAEKSILEHPLLRGLLSEGFNEEPAAIAADAPLDKLFAPSDLIQVVDADSSQTVVIETVRAGRNLVVQGPPGTGKSQTITNIIASAAHDGKSVLFVAEKMAALDVVHARLRRVGLGPICLELHSRSANKKQVLAEVEATLEHHAVEPDGQAEIARLTELRATLNAVDERMHAPVGETGTTPFQALSRLISAAGAGIASHPALLAEAATWTKGDHALVVDGATRLVEVTAAAGPCFQHPYYGVAATLLQPAELARLSAPLTALADAAVALVEPVENIADYLGVGGEASFDFCSTIISILQIIETLPSESAEVVANVADQSSSRILEAARAGMAWSDLKATAAENFVDAAWDTPAAPLRTSLASGLSFFGRIWSDYRQSSNILATLIRNPLPKKARDRIELVDRLVAVEKVRDDLKADDAAMAAMIPLYWRGEGTDFATLHAAASAVQALATHDARPRIDSAIEIVRRGFAVDYIAEISRSIEAMVRAVDDVLPILKVDVVKAFRVAGWERIPLRSVAAKAHLWRESQERFDEWRRLSATDARLRAASATALADALAVGSVPADKAKAVLDCTYAEAVWKKAVAAAPALQEFYGPQHDALAAEFRSLEAKRRQTTVEIVRCRHAAKMPRGNYGAMNTIRSETKRKRGHMPIRKLFKAAGETLQRIKPVLLMSPISVAQFVPPGSVEFDLLIIDEASQVRPEDALGLIARVKQIVVVGDNKQLPPTSFFDRVVADEEEHEDIDEAMESALAGAAKATELESILALCEARGLNSAMLRWHYRSRHPSLIEVSNAEFYRRLIMPPAPSSDRAKEGLILRRVAGAYDRGGKRINTVEAEAVAKAVAEHARASPNLSLGVATFSTVQRDAIGDLLDMMRRTDDALDAFLREGKGEDVFVKNLENVQGDERDVIFVSVGYGPRVAGARLDSMGFGPVSAEGGERRLNVLFTRARSRCEIFCSFASGDIDPDRAKGEGARILKRFLKYAETGVIEEQISTSQDADSPFEEAVAAVMEGLGYKVDKQVGSAGFKIDLAVRHPSQSGRYMLAVECDGATYHRALWARERDRLRQEVLENMGWRFHRIWSTDWFYRRGEAIEKLKAAIEEAKAAAPVKGPKEAAPVTASVSIPRPDFPTPNPSTPGPKNPPYQLAEYPVPPGAEPHLTPVAQMALVTRAIVATEGPIHQDEVARRVTSLFGKSRTGSLISAASLKSLQALKRSIALVEEDAFWMTPGQLADPPVRDRSSAPISLQRADMLSPREIRAAAGIATRENGSLSDDEMAMAVTRLLGFKRTGPDLKVAIAKALQG
jgi:very-short-patch-repair endonuclease